MGNLFFSFAVTTGWTGVNMKLQGENHNVNEMSDKITVFKRRVQLWDLKM
jgi:hypothetical protein